MRIRGTYFIFFTSVNCWLNSYGKFGGAARRRFFTICEEPEGADNRPPAVRGLIVPLIFRTNSQITGTTNCWLCFSFCRVKVIVACLLSTRGSVLCSNKPV